MSGHPQTLSPLEVLRLYPAHGGTLASLLASRASVDPQRPFLWFQGRTISNSDPITGQAGWYDVRVRIRPAQPPEADEPESTQPRVKAAHEVQA